MKTPDITSVCQRRNGFTAALSGLFGLIALLLLPASPVGAIAGYGDVVEGQYYSNAVQWSVDHNITGITDNCFLPTQGVTRGEAAVWLWRMSGQPAQEDRLRQSNLQFIDVASAEQQQPVAWMVTQGITNGTTPTTFSPDNTLTRAQAAAFLFRLAKPMPSVVQHNFGDVTREWQQQPVAWMVTQGITNGTTPTTFSPDNTLTRSQFIAFLYRYKGSPPVDINPLALDCGAENTRATGSAFADLISHPQAPEMMCLSVHANDRVAVDWKVRDPLVPASLMKIVTATAVLEVMSPEETFETTVVVSSDAWNATTTNTFKGDIFLIGGGDPVIATPEYASRFHQPLVYTDITSLADEVFAALQAKGITRIEGRIVGDASWYLDGELDYTNHYLEGNPEPVWKRSFLTQNNVGPLSGLLINRGSANGRWVADPARHAASQFDDLLEHRGMVITRRAVGGIAPEPSARFEVGHLHSPPVADILLRMLSRSDNTIAELLFKEVGRRISGTAGDANASRITSAANVQAIMNERLGDLVDGLVIADGSGLSYHNRLTCAAVTELLRQAGPDSLLVSNLAVPSVRGTLRSCGPNEPTTNTLRAKTGQLNVAKSLAGMVVTPNDGVIIFTMIANEPRITRYGYCSNLFKALLNLAGQYTYSPSP